MFGSRNPRPTPPRQTPSQQTAGSYNRLPQGDFANSGSPNSYGRSSTSSQRPLYDGAAPEYHRGENARTSAIGQAGHKGQTWQLRPTKSPGDQFIFGNLYVLLPFRAESFTEYLQRVAVSPSDFPPSLGSDLYIILNDSFVLSARPFNGFPQGQLSLSDPQRTWASISLMDVVNVRLYDPFQEGGNRYLGSLDAEISFAGRKTTEVPFDQDDLALHFNKVDPPESVKVPPNSIRLLKTKSLHLIRDSSWITRVFLFLL